MTARSTAQPAEVTRYLRDLAMRREDAVRLRLRERTASLEMARMQISAEQGQFLSQLVSLMGARRVLEVGVFTGYSALCMAQALPADGRLVACDLSEEWTSIGRSFWEEAGVAERIELRLGDASETLSALLEDGEAGSFDLAFVDADKEGYGGYCEQVFQLLRPGGLVAFDNMLMGGRVLDPDTTDPGPRHVLDLTERLWADERVEPVFVPMGDGVVLLRKL